MSEEMITISKEEYYRLVDVDDLMDALRAAGIDNWDGYEEAYAILEELNGEN